MFCGNILICILVGIFLPFHFASAQDLSDRYQQESDHFIVIYWKSHEYLAPRILASAENALTRLTSIFHYRFTEKIIIYTNDYHDFGGAGTTSVPHNFIRLDIAPFELDYENIPFDDRIKWLITHELVHVIVGDGVSTKDSFSRNLFSKVPPEREQPLSIFYSLLTNFERFSPDWHQEGIAMFMETWLNGGFGRVQGSFDEMFFRAMVYENKEFPSLIELDAKVAATSYLLQMQYYLYGARFSAYLATRFGSDTFIEWYRYNQTDNYKWFDKKFQDIFKLPLNKVWSQFIQDEKIFQRTNLELAAKKPYTPIRYLSEKSYGWVTQPMLNHHANKILFGSHNSHNLAAIVEINLEDKAISTIATLPTPRMVQVAAVAIDPRTGLVFFTTNNNYLHRDLWILDPVTRIKKMLFKDIRIGDLTACPATGELWGVRHSSGRAALLLAKFPYTDLLPVAEFSYENSIQHLSISPSGRWLAATLHQSTGEQKIIIIALQKLTETAAPIYQVVSDVGSPEHPSWSPDETTLLWNAYVNGISNIYQCDLKTRQIYALSHTPRGLFRPLYLSPDSLFAFEFTSEGFVPVIIPNKPADYLPAIAYFGQKLFQKEPQLANLALPKSESLHYENEKQSRERKYHGLKNVHRDAFIPIATGFMDQVALGFYGQFSDPLLIHDLKIEAAYSPWPSNDLMPRIHFDIKYEYKKTWMLRYQNNASNFYDIFNQRKRGTIQKKLLLNNAHYWKYDLPQKIKHVNELALYLDTQAINDNMTKINKPDFIVYQSVLENVDLRRSIGSVDNEQGTKWTATLMTFHVNPQDMKHVGGIHLEWESYRTWKWPHNIIMLNLSAGIRHVIDYMPQGKFYFGGFGNRYLENDPVEQYRKVFRFPGIPIYSIPAKQFGKITIENKLPPLRFGKACLGHHYLSHLDATIFAQGLAIERNWQSTWIDLGAQINFQLKHWYNLESTISLGLARAWHCGQDSWEWFISFKPLRS